MIDLLDSVGIHDRIVCDYKEFSEIDYSAVKELLKLQINYSKAYLNTVLNGVE